MCGCGNCTNPKPTEQQDICTSINASFEIPIYVYTDCARKTAADLSWVTGVVAVISTITSGVASLVVTMTCSLPVANYLRPHITLAQVQSLFTANKPYYYAIRLEGADDYSYPLQEGTIVFEQSAGDLP